MTNWTCPDCGNVNDDELLMCKCGSERTEAQGFDRNEQAERPLFRSAPDVKKQMRHRGYVDLVLGGFILLLSYHRAGADFVSSASFTMGCLVVIWGILLIRHPSPIILLMEGLMLIVTGCWSMFVAYLYAMAQLSDAGVLRGLLTFLLGSLILYEGISRILQRKELSQVDS